LKDWSRCAFVAPGAPKPSGLRLSIRDVLERFPLIDQPGGHLIVARMDIAGLQAELDAVARTCTSPMHVAFCKHVSTRVAAAYRNIGHLAMRLDQKLDDAVGTVSVKALQLIGDARGDASLCQSLCVDLDLLCGKAYRLARGGAKIDELVKLIQELVAAVARVRDHDTILRESMHSARAECREE
jgi:hypothetical protein